MEPSMLASQPLGAQALVCTLYIFNNGYKVQAVGPCPLASKSTSEVNTVSHLEGRCAPLGPGAISSEWHRHPRTQP